MELCELTHTETSAAKQDIDNKASDVLKVQDSLTAEDRKLLENEVAEAVCQPSCKSSAHRPVIITIEIKVEKEDDVPKRSTSKRTPTNILDGTKRIGPFVFEGSSNTRNYQLVAISTYAFIILFAAFIGPKLMLITLWKLFVALIAYIIAGRLFGWEIDGEVDIVIAPVVCAAYTVHNAVCDAIDRCAILKVSVGARAVSESEAVVDPEE